jgi:hypothetical protein
MAAKAGAAHSALITQSASPVAEMTTMSDV